jgi:hypothetical protein
MSVFLYEKQSCFDSVYANQHGDMPNSYKLTFKSMAWLDLDNQEPDLVVITMKSNCSA